jgi:hypothetical protein
MIKTITTIPLSAVDLTISQDVIEKSFTREDVREKLNLLNELNVLEHDKASIEGRIAEVTQKINQRTDAKFCGFPVVSEVEFKHDTGTAYCLTVSAGISIPHDTDLLWITAKVYPINMDRNDSEVAVAGYNVSIYATGRLSGRMVPECLRAPYQFKDILSYHDARHKALAALRGVLTYLEKEDVIQ